MSIDYPTLTLDQLENMSDEEFAQIDASQLPDPQELVQPEPDQHQNEEVAVDPALETQETETPVVEEALQEEVQEPVNEVAPNGEQAEGAGLQAGDDRNEQGEGTGTEPQAQEDETTPVDVSPEKAFFDRVTASFQANGKEFQITDPADVISLMQKGLNYNQKLAAMKPGLKLVKALQDNGINSVEDLGFLLDLKAKKPEAIAKLVQEAGIDTYDLNEDKANAYQPSVPQVTDEQINFEMTAKALETNPHFGRVVQELGSYDDSTKEQIFKSPHLLNVLTEHVGLGYYDKIMARLEQEQALGRLTGIPFLQAYDHVGNMLFGQPQQQPAQQVQKPTQVINPTPVPVAQKPNPVNNTARQAAAGSPGTAAPTQKLNLTPEQLWNLPEDEFKKIDPKFL